MLHQHPLDGLDPLQVVAGGERPTGEELVTSGLQLEQDELEPKLEGLVDNDEQQLVMGLGPGQGVLQREQLGNAKVTSVGEVALFLTRRGPGFPLVADLVPPARKASLTDRARRRKLTPGAFSPPPRPPGTTRVK